MQYVLIGILEEGKVPEGICVYALDGQNKVEVKDAQVVLVRDQEKIVLSYSPDRGYCLSSEEGGLVLAGKTYSVEVSVNEVTLKAQTQVPLVPNMLQMSTPSFSVEASTENSLVFSCLWGGSDSLSYLLQLRNTELSPTQIPFVNGGNRFSQSFAGPYDSQGLSLVGGDFGFYGRHVLSIIAISPQYRDVLLRQSTDDRNFLLNGPDNIDGGAGFFTSVARRNLELEVSP